VRVYALWGDGEGLDGRGVGRGGWRGGWGAAENDIDQRRHLLR
jgi:hypothetical protein